LNFLLSTAVLPAVIPIGFDRPFGNAQREKNFSFDHQAHNSSISPYLTIAPFSLISPRLLLSISDVYDHPMFFILIFSSSESYILYEGNHTGYHRFTLEREEFFGIVMKTAGLEIQVLIELDFPTLSSVSFFISEMTPIVLTFPAILFSPASLPAYLLLNADIPSVNISVWTINQSLCHSASSVLMCGDSGRFRFNYKADALETRCFFPLTSFRNLTFDFWVDSFNHPLMEVYTDVNITNGRGPWLSQTLPISKAHPLKPVFFTVTGVHSKSQVALNLNFSGSHPELENACEFQQSLVWNGTKLSQPENPNLDHREQCNVQEESATTWIYLASTFVADGSLGIIVLVAWCAFRRWQKQEEKLILTGESKQQSQPIFGRQRGDESLSSFEGPFRR
jgi:hypothetical protein